MRASRLPGLTSGTGANTGGRSGGAGSGGRLRGAGTGGHFRGAGTGESGAPSGLDKGTRDEGGLDGTSGDDGERRWWAGHWVWSGSGEIIIGTDGEGRSVSRQSPLHEGGEILSRTIFGRQRSARSVQACIIECAERAVRVAGGVS